MMVSVTTAGPMTVDTIPALADLRSQSGPWTSEQSVPPSSAELSELRKTIPGISFPPGRIELPLAPLTQRMGRVTLGVWIVGVCSAVAIAATAVHPPFNAFLPWFVIHTTWILTLLAFADYRSRRRAKLTIFPSSTRCQVIVGPLVIESFHDRNLFGAFPKRDIGITPHVGHLLLMRTKGTIDDRGAAAAVLNRFALFGLADAAPVDPGPILPGRFVRWILENTDCIRLDLQRLTFRTLPVGAWIAGAIFTWLWLYMLGPALVGLEVLPWRVSHLVMVAISAATILWYRWEHRPRLVTLFGGRGTVSTVERSGVERSHPTTVDSFVPEGEDVRASLRFVEPGDGRSSKRKAYRIAVAASDAERFEEPIWYLGRYLGGSVGTASSPDVGERD